MMGNSSSVLTQRAITLQALVKREIEQQPMVVKMAAGNALTLVDQMAALMVELAKKVEGDNHGE